MDNEQREIDLRRWHRIERRKYENGGWVLAGREWRYWREIGFVLELLDRERVLPTRRAPNSEDTIAVTPRTALMALPVAPPPVDPGDQFSAPVVLDDATLGWNACLVAVEERIAKAAANAIRDKDSVVDLRTAIFTVLRMMRRS